MSAIALRLAAALAVFCSLALVSGQSTGSYGFQTILTSYTGAAGTAHAYLDASASILSVAAQWSGLTGAPTAIHIHGCLPSPATLYNSSGVIIDLGGAIPQYNLGVSGQFLSVFDLSQTSTYKWTSTGTAAQQQQQFLNCLTNGTAYFNLHTARWGAGELSGILQQTTQVNASWTTLTQNPGATVPTTGQGLATLLYNANTHEVFIGAFMVGLTSNITKVHWHGCSPTVNVSTSNYIIKMNPTNIIGALGGSFVNYYNLLNGAFLDSTFVNSIPGFTYQAAEQTLWKCYINGSSYFNVHTAANNASGELWGWYTVAHPIQSITPSPDALTTYTTVLNAYATNGGAGGPVGYASATLDVNSRLIYADATIFSPGLTGAPTAAHIHGCTAASARFPFSTAGIVVPLNPAGVNVGTAPSVTGEFQNVFDASLISTYDAAFLSAYNLTNQYWVAEALATTCLQNEQTYINIHTPNNPAGEASGVLTPSNQVIQLIVRSSSFLPEGNNVPAGATAHAYLLWDMAAHLLWVNVTFSGLSGALTAAHIHGCLPSHAVAIPLDITGSSTLQIVQSINTASISTYAAGWSTNGTALPQAWYYESTLASCFFNNSLYINLHTANNPAGEIYGVISLDANDAVPSTSPGPSTQVSAAFQFTLSLVSTLMPAAVLAMLLKGY